MSPIATKKTRVPTTGMQLMSPRNRESRKNASTRGRNSAYCTGPPVDLIERGFTAEVIYGFETKPGTGGGGHAIIRLNRGEQLRDGRGLDPVRHSILPEHIRGLEFSGRDHLPHLCRREGTSPIPVLAHVPTVWHRRDPCQEEKMNWLTKMIQTTIVRTVDRPPSTMPIHA